jgi:hypothetical protein
LVPNQYVEFVHIEARRFDCLGRVNPLTKLIHYAAGTSVLISAVGWGGTVCALHNIARATFSNLPQRQVCEKSVQAKFLR